MNLELFIAKGIIRKDKTHFSRSIIRLAVIGIAIGLAVMITSIAIVTGFKKQIQEKIIGFGSHIQISKYDNNASFESQPISKQQDFIQKIKTIDGIQHIQAFAIKAGIIKTKDEIQGAIIKGVGKDFDWSFFKNKIVEGKTLSFNDTVASNDILISKRLATLLNLKLNDPVAMYFIQDPPRARKFNIAGIYETGLEEFDKIYIIGDIRHIQKLNDWQNDQITGFEILVTDFNGIDRLGKSVNEEIGYNLKAQTIKELHPEIFDWLELSNTNVIIIIILMTLVASITMISTLLILILERTQMIGTLKALGSTNWGIRKIFLYNATYIIGKGLLWGNIIGLAICYIQRTFHLISLPQESYYVSEVPIYLTFTSVLFINLFTFIICLFMLIIPTYIVTKITPIKAIRFN